ncbi:hypothetical protein [Actinacidiphila paucisporea]|uniref:Tautomerase enzyme n=1 Tax=Actinacidiphila paucisporea TaxID=310782 RepID=A0A1M7HAV6_9ACTN|nr:hypothetical protein [Actinacidiphila paucisporea]SHM25560.1 hypothetical protein SAMN05216499_109214 [Actinacidiphila paucisporea]
MPVIEVYAPVPGPGAERLRALSNQVTTLLGNGPGLCWVMWSHVGPAECYRPEWDAGSIAPVVFVTCKDHYPAERVAQLNATVAEYLAKVLDCPLDEVYVADRRVRSGELFTRGVTARWDTAPSGDAVTASDNARGDR